MKNNAIRVAKKVVMPCQSRVIVWHKTFNYNQVKKFLNGRSGRLKSMTYANGWEVKLSYDRFGKIVAEKWYYNNSSIPSYEYEYAYNKSGELVRSIDKTALREYTYSYRDGTLVKICECKIITLDTTGEVSAREPVNIIACEYGQDGELSKKVYSVIGMSAEYTSGENTSIVKHLMAGTEVDTVTSVSDHLGRITGEQVKVGNTAVITRAFEYAPGVVSAVHTSNNKVPSAPTTNLVSRIAVGNRSFQYTYDAEEKITSVVDSNGQSVVYTYDEQGRLTRETSSSGSARYIYDRFGNIIEKGDWDEDTNSFAENENHMVFTYYNSPRDRIGLIQCGKSGFSLLQYDNAGNPTTYKDSINLTWEKGRQLKTYGDHSFTYNANGIRTSRSYQTAVNGTSVNVRYDYYLEDTKPVRIKLQDSRFGNPEMLPLYDTSDSPIGIILTRDGTSGTRVTSRYWYVKNLQGDVVAIRDESGTDVVQYSYNAWGKVTVVSDTTTFSLSTLNPFLYRSYLYDSETGLYYLQSRYYDPEIGRFINADEMKFIESINNCNLFTYCENNCVNMSDRYGQTPNYIYDQDDISIKDIPWGTKGNTGDNGCGWISVYNVLTSYSKKVTHDSVIKDLTKINAPLFGGEYGANPLKLFLYLRTKFWFVTIPSSTLSLWLTFLSDAIIVLLMWDNGVMHYVAGISTKKGIGNKKYKFYNSGLYDKETGDIDGKAITLKKFMQYVKEKNAVAVCLITMYKKKGKW